MSLGRAEDTSFVSGIVVCCRCHRESRHQEGGGIAQAWATWPKGASAPNGTVMCRGTEYPIWVMGNEDNSSFARFFKLNKICHELVLNFNLN